VHYPPHAPRILLLLLIAIAARNVCAADLLGQRWVRDADAPTLSLGAPGSFDDTHLFAPCVIEEKGIYSLYYCGSQKDVANRVFQMGLATSTDGIHFTKRPGPVFDFGDGKHSVLTPTMLRNPDGSVRREDGRLRMWFTAADLAGGSGVHTLHESSSEDGVHWSDPSPAQMGGVYAPTVIKEHGRYRMWYSDVSAEPWIVRHADSDDGIHWRPTETPALVIDQDWERGRLFYPTVIKEGDRYVMWYGAYWSGRENTTAIGTAVSLDGLTWVKAPDNPVFTPDERRPWESHYTTSQSVLKQDGGSWRMWYASRKAPPFDNKYFAMGTARWDRPASLEAEAAGWPARAAALRARMAAALTLPETAAPLDVKTHRTTPGDGYTIESVTYGSEPGSRVTAHLYLPAGEGPFPGLILACGHGGSKSALYAQYAGQLYAKYGFALLAVDTIGEEERNKDRKMGSRAHDLYHLPKEERGPFMENEMGRSILGKIVWDLMRGIDYLQARPEMDGARIGAIGSSLGGASATSLAILDERVRAAVISGWGFIPSLGVKSKPCTQVPYRDFAAMMDFGEMTALFAPHAATIFLNGTADSIIDPDEDGAALTRGVKENLHRAKALLGAAGVPHALEAAFEEDACHRPYILTSRAVRWMGDHLQGGVNDAQFATVHYGTWAESQGQRLEKLYDTEARQRGTAAVDIGALYRDPASIACLPLDAPPPAEYTFEGWMQQCLANPKGSDCASAPELSTSATESTNPTPFDEHLLATVRAYADTMLEKGRDRYGAQHSPLFAAALDRNTLSLLEGDRLEEIKNIPHDEWGIRNHDRALTGSNPMHDQNLYQILYALGEITGEARYEAAADDALRWFFTHTHSPETHLLAWGEHLSWDFREEQPFLASGGAGTHEFYRPWVLWPRTFELAGDGAARYAAALWEHQIGDHETGAFSRHAGFASHRTGTKDEYPRHGGFYIATWANAYAATGDEAYLRHIETLVGYFESRRNKKTGALPAESAERSRGMTIWSSSNLSLAIDLTDGAAMVPAATSALMRACAEKVDGTYLSLEHDLSAGGRGFTTSAHIETLETQGRTRLWATGYGQATDAQVANMCLMRYEQRPLEGYKTLALQAADRYLDSAPDTTIPLYPGALADAMELLINCYQMEGDEKYLARAAYFAEEGLRIFFGDSSLPRASAQHGHYEAITRGDTLAMALLKLWAVKNKIELQAPLIWNER